MSRTVFLNEALTRVTLFHATYFSALLYFLDCITGISLRIWLLLCFHIPRSSISLSSICLYTCQVANARHNVTLLPPSVASYTSVERLDWANRDTWPLNHGNKKKNSSDDGGSKGAAEDRSSTSGTTNTTTTSSNDSEDSLFDVVFGSDLVYDASIGPLLASAVAGLCKSNGHFLCVHERELTFLP